MVQLTPEFIQETAVRANRNMVEYFGREIPRLLSANPDPLSKLSPLFQNVTDVNEYIDSGFIDRISDLYSPEDRQFILDISNRFERVKLGFAYFSLIDANKRPSESLSLAHMQLRTGWQKTGISLERNQTLADHLEGTKSLALHLFFDEPNVETIARICEYHDAGEPVIGDFTPYCPISRDDKSRIELLGVRLITAARLREPNPLADWIHEAVTTYDGNDPVYNDVRSQVRDCDLLEMCVEALYMMTHSSQEQNEPINQNLQEFWNYVGTKLASDRAKNFFAAIEPQRYRTNIDVEDYKNMVQQAYRQMLDKDPHPTQAYAKFREIVTVRDDKENQFELKRAPI